jgi:exodeoxyribonuclease V beta subunit
MSEISPELCALDVPTLVEASAGTGKTHTITTYFVRGILERGLRPEQVLVVTYTKAATAELRVRCRTRVLQALHLLDGSSEEDDALEQVVMAAMERLGRPRTEELLRGALREMDQTSILTIHGFCQRLLQDHPLLFGIDFDFEVTEASSSIRAELAVDFWVTDLYERPPWLLRALASRKVDTDHLVKLASVASTPGVGLVGPPRPDGSAQQSADHAAALHAQAASIWADDREEVCAILLRDPGLHRRQYSPKTIENAWIPALESLFKEGEAQPLPGFFRKLSPAHMKVKKGHDKPKHRFFDACARLQDADDTLESLLDYEVFAFKARFIEFVQRKTRQRRREAAVLSFDDLLTTVYAPWDQSSKRDYSVDPDEVAKTIASTYPLALVDEFQDTDSVQYGIFKAIYGEGAVVYVGDPKQAIYAFRGADVFSYLDAAADVGERKHTLRTNRRSDPGLVRAINTLFSQRERPFVVDGIDFELAIPYEMHARSSITPPMDVLFVDEERLKGPIEEAVAPIVANEIAHLLSSTPSIEGRVIGPGDVAVLCRSNKQASAVTKALRALRIPTTLDGDSSVLDTEVASDLRAVLEATLMPGDSPGVRRALLTSLIGVSPPELASMKDAEWSAWVSRFREWNATWHGQGVVRFLEDMLWQTGAETRLAASPAARRDLTDLAHIEELLMRGEREKRRDPVALMQWFRRLDEGSPHGGAVASESLQQRPDAQTEAVRVATIHKSKGLEYGVVYVPFTWDDAGLRLFDKQAIKFHDEQGRIRIDLGSSNREEHLRQSEREACSEAIRLLYVAVTRARHHCALLWGRATGWNDSALARLLHGHDGLGTLDEEAMRADLEALGEASGGTIGSRPPRIDLAPIEQDEAPGAALNARQATRRFDQTGRIGSFTSLTGLDEKVPAPRSEPPSPGAQAPLFAELPGGARTGLLLHSILERVDLSELHGTEAREIIEEHLRLHGFDPGLERAVQRDLKLVASIPLTAGEDPPRLVDLPRNRQLRELEFTLHAERPNLAGLASILRQHGEPRSAPEYHLRLADVGRQTLQRYLRGYIDLLFEWRGRWYVADYKSNALASYDAAAMAEAAQREHYVLQGQLYSAAAQRYLKQRLPAYDWATDWGGTLFLFLRGMRGGKPSAGVLFDRQPAELLDAVDRWLGGEDGSR